MRVSPFAALLLALCAPPAAGQWIRGADTVSARTVADSQAVLRDLNFAVQRAPYDAALRYRVGLVAWLLAVRSEFKPPVRGLNGPLLKGLADSSLRLAVQLDPGNARYELTLGRFMRASSDAILRLQAPAHVDAALTLSLSATDSAVHAEALMERGRLSWLRYDTDASQIPRLACQDVRSMGTMSSNPVAMRPIPQSVDATGGLGGVDTRTMLMFNNLHNTIVSCIKASPQAGELEYTRAEGLFRELYARSPLDDRAFRYLAMLLAEKGRWPELASIARDRINRLPNDGWAWLDLALALHRGDKSARAAAVFDTAITRLGPSESGRLFAFQRLLNEADSAAYSARPAVERAQWEGSAWSSADPLWSREGYEPRVEFLARVAFAELRWTVEEMNVRGADSDRGNIYIRYGPPTNVIALRGCEWRDDPILCYDAPGLRPPNEPLRPGVSDVVTYWDYDIGLTVVFWGAPTYGTARFPVVDLPHIEYATDTRSSAFENIAKEKILAMPLAITRFRAPGDSVDILVLARAPMAAIRDVTDNAEVRANAWLLGRKDSVGLRDTTVLGATGIERAVYRVAPDQYLYRVEATAPGTMVAGRATRWVTADRDTITGFTTRGFGISDLLFATALTPGKPVPARWRDFNIAPLLGPLPTQGTVNLVWENYLFGARGGQTQYGVVITLERQRTAGGRIAAAILGFAANTVGVDQGDDRVTFRFERAGPAAPAAFVDRVAIAMNDTPSGDYRVTLEVTDKVSGRKAKAVAQLVITR